MNNTDTIRFDQKQTIAAYERQVENLQKLLTLQTNETNYCQDHITLLNKEVDSLRKIIEEKQKSIHDLNRQLKKKQEYVTELEKKYDESKIDRLAFVELEERNIQLLEGLKAKQLEFEKSQVENRYLQEHRNDRLLLEEAKSKKALELEITFPFERTQLQVRLDHAQDVNNQQSMRIQMLETQVQFLSQQLDDYQEKMKDNLLRSKQSEYKMLMELDSKDIENHALDIQNHQMRLTQESLTSQANELTAQLQNSIQQTESLQTLFSSTIHTLESDVHQLQHKEKLLSRENQMLQYEGQVQKEMISRASTTLLESGRLPSKKDKKKSSNVNPLSLSATLPLSRNDNGAKSRPSSATRPQSQSTNNRSNTLPKQRTKQVASPNITKRSPLTKFENHSNNDNSRVSTASMNILLDEPLQTHNRPNSYSSNSNSSRLQTAIPKFQTPYLVSPMSSPLKTKNDSVLTAFSPSATGMVGMSDGDMDDPVSSRNVFTNQKMLPQHEVLTVDLKNTMLHRYMQLICRIFEAISQVEKLLKAPKKTSKPTDLEEDDDTTSSVRNMTLSSSFFGRKNSDKLNENPFLSLSIGEEINLNNCSLIDTDLNAVIDWLRTIPVEQFLPYVFSISFQHNKLSSDALMKIFAWISSFSVFDWQLITGRGRPIEFDFKYNHITYESIAEAIKHMRNIGNPDIAYIALLEESNERKIIFHVKSRMHQQGSCIALIMDVNKQKGDHKNRLLRQSMSQSRQQKDQDALEKKLISLSFREPIVSKIQTFSTESVYPILQTAGIISAGTGHNFQLQQQGYVEDDEESKLSNVIPRDLIMTHNFIG